MKQFFIVSFCLLLGSAGCWKDDLTPQINNDTQCEGAAPQADLQDGVCAGALKVCHTPTLEWVEPDYTAITGFEATEATCDGVDNDCDGTIDEELTSAFYPDLDDDGYGDLTAEAVMACAKPEGHVSDHTDCDDTSDQRNPGASEICDGLDNDCDGDVDEDLPTQVWYVDADDDGYGAADDTGTEACGTLMGRVLNNLDCDDTQDTISPDATELCDGLDNNCDEVIDDDAADRTLWYEDVDGDGFGDSAVSELACEAPMGYVADGSDCALQDGNHWADCMTCVDLDGDAYGAGCDLGDDCDDSADTGPACRDTCGIFFRDADGDGRGSAPETITACTVPTGYVSDSTDCDDASAMHWSDCGVCIDLDGDGFGVDCNLGSDCDDNVDTGAGCHDSCAMYYEDQDTDGYGDASRSVLRCVVPTGYVSNSSDCAPNDGEHWNDCTECVDTDGDGYGVGCDQGLDCDDSLTTGGACNDSCSDWYRDADGDTYGDASNVLAACSQPAGFVTNHTDCDDTRAAVNPGATEVCNGVDDNCVGGIDEGLTAPLCAKQSGVCAGARQTCGGTSGWLACTDANYLAWNAAYEPTEATCDGLDNDCDASVDEGVQTSYYPDADGDTYGSSTATAVMACTAPANHVLNHTDCDDTRAAVHPGATELCDGLDNDCDASTDDGSAEAWLGQACDGTDADLCNEGTFSCTLGAKTCSDPNDIDLDLCDGLDNDCDGVIDAGTCGANASCYDAGGTQAATCECDSGYVELPAEPGVCHEALQPDVGDLVITEVMIQPTNSATTIDGQYFEIYNTTDATLVLTDIGFYVTDGLLDATSEVGVAILLAPKARWIIGANATPAENGGLTVDHEFTTMVQLYSLGGGIEIYRVSSNTLIDDILWDDTWNHAVGASLSLSPGATDADIVTLNDEGAHWCHTRFTTYGTGDHGTPGAGNDHCLVQWCKLQWPPDTATTAGTATENIFGQVYEPGVTDAGGQGDFIVAQLGYGGSGTPADGTWTWFDAVYNVDSGNNDEYRQTLTIATPGDYDYAYRMSLDGGLTHVYCDTDGVHGYGGAGVYDFAFNGALTVN